MRTADTVRLVILAAIWGGSFIFMRVLAPVLGPVLTADLRVLIAGIALLIYFRAIKLDLEWRQYWKQYILIGALNSALPFFLFSFAALHIPASLSVILNSTAPFFGALFAAMLLGERFTFKKLAGLVIGAIGVMMVVKLGSVTPGPMFALAVLACIGATVCYGFVATYIKRFGTSIKPMAVAGASQLTAGLLLLPAVPFSPLRGEITPTIVAGVIVFALLCSAVAYLLYFRLVVDAGPTKALTVTFLMPAFGMLWGAMFLNELITPTMVAGTALILLGTGLVLNVLKWRAPAVESVRN
ncbi:MAG: DMT family transporter [Candidatus Zixiibacteriota bacterium]